MPMSVHVCVCPDYGLMRTYMLTFNLVSNSKLLMTKGLFYVTYLDITEQKEATPKLSNEPMVHLKV